MQIRRLFRYALVPALAFGLAVQGASNALAEEEGDAPSKKVRVRIARPKPLQPEGQAPTRNSPVSSVMRWAMQEMGPPTGEGHGADTKKMLTQWFDGGADVPMSGLRDALKADGWDASSLIRWMHREGGQLMAMAPMVMQMLGSQGGQGPALPMGPMRGGNRSPRTWHMQGPMHGMGFHGAPGRGACPQCGHAGHGQGARSWGPRRFHGRGMGRHGMQRGGMNRGGMGHQSGMRRWGRRPQGMRPGPGHGHGMGHGRQPMQSSRTIILWNDGSGWHRQELPAGQHHGGGADHGQHAPTWLSQMLEDARAPRGHMGHGQMPHGESGPHGRGDMRGPEAGANRHGPEVQGGAQWSKMLERIQGAQPNLSPEDLQRMIESLTKQVQALEGKDALRRRLPEMREMRLKLKSFEELLKRLGREGAPGVLHFDDVEKLLNSLGVSGKDPESPGPGGQPIGSSDRKVHIRLVKPKDAGNAVEIIEEEAIKNVETGK